MSTTGTTTGYEEYVAIFDELEEALQRAEDRLVPLTKTSDYKLNLIASNSLSGVRRIRTEKNVLHDKRQGAKEVIAASTSER